MSDSVLYYFRDQLVSRSRAFRFALILFIGCCGLSEILATEVETTLLPQQEPPTQSRPHVPAADIDRWIEQLDDDRYDIREIAQQQLAAAGKPSLEAVAEVARSGALESSTRAINIFLSWSESKDHDLKIAALEQLVTLANHPREALAAANLLSHAHEQAALADIVAMGGHHRPADGLSRNGQQRLQIVFDSQWKGGNAGLDRLAEVPRASLVSFYLAPVEDEGLVRLTQMPNIQRVELYGTRVSTETIKLLKRRIPDVEVRSGAQLGIQGTPHGGVPRVANMVKGGAAEKAGLELGDAITEINGENMEDFSALTRRIAQFHPGDTAELTLVRQGKILNKKVTFDRWKIETSQVGSSRRAGRPPSNKILPQPPPPHIDRR